MAKDLRLNLILGHLETLTSPLKKIQGGSSKAAAALRNQRQQLKQLQAQQRDVNSFKKLQAETAKNAKKLDEARARANALAKQLKATDKPSKTLTTRFKQATSNAGKLKVKLGQNREKLHSLNSELKKGGINTKYLDRSQAKLKRQMDKTNMAMQQQKQKLDQINKRQKQMAKLRKGGMSAGIYGAAAAFAGQRASSGLFNILTPGIGFHEQMSAVQAVSRLSKDDPRFQMLKQQAEKLGETTSFSSLEVASGQEFLGRAGFSPEAINSSMKDILALAKANRVDLGRSADIVSNIAGAFRLDPEVNGNIEGLADLLTATSTRANVNLEMLGETMKYLGQADGLNLSMQQAAAMAGLLGNIGIQGSQAGTTLRAMLTRLAAPTGEAKTAIKELELQVTDTAGNLRNIPDILADINEKTSRMGNAQRTTYLKQIFGEEPGSGMAQLIAQEGTKGITSLVNILNNVKGENLRVADIMGDNAAGDLKALSSAWQGISNTLMDTNKGPLRGTIKTLTEMLRGFNSWMKENPKIAAGLLTIAGIGAGLLTVMGGLGLMVGGTMVMFSGFSKILGPLGLTKIPMVLGALKSLSLFLLTNPIGWAILAIGAAGALIYANWETVGPFFKNLWQEIQQAFEGGIIGITKLLLSWSPMGLIVRAYKGLWDMGNEFMGEQEAKIDNSGRKVNRYKRHQPIRMAAAGGSNSTTTIEAIHVHPSQGMDEQQLAAMVGQEVKRAQTRRDVANRSRLRDND